jgi:hypothetical protein
LRLTGVTGEKVQKPYYGKELKVLTMIFDQALERIFGKSGKLLNIAHDACLAMLICTVALLPVYKTTGAEWASLAGVACLFAAIIFEAIAFSAQSISQLIRLLSNIVAKINGQEPTVFKEDDPLYAKLIKKAFKITKARSANLFSPRKVSGFSRVSSIRTRVRTNARTHGRASRTSFARSSGGSVSSGDSGESDSGDPPGPSHHLTPLTLFSCSTIKLNSPSRPWRSLRSPGYWRVSCPKFSPWRWTV